MARQSKTQKKSRGGTLIGMFIGLVLGVCLAAGVVWFINRANTPFPGTRPAAATPPKANAPAAPPGQQAVIALPGKPGDPVPEKRFQFYDILPGKTDAVPTGKPGDAKKPDATEPRKEDGKEAKKEDKKDEKKDDAKELKQPVFLQAGSFAVAQDADNQKARLALMGMEATVLQVMVQDKTWYRVRLGPFTKMDEASKVRSELAKAGIEASIAKKE